MHRFEREPRAVQEKEQGAAVAQPAQ